MNNFLMILIIGISILIVALVINVLANFLNIPTWYDFIKIIGDEGLVIALRKIGFYLVFLFLIYPFILGATGYYVMKLLN